MKIDIETLKYIAQRNIDDKSVVSAIMQEVQLEIQAQEEERANRPPQVKKQLAIVLSDHDGSLADRDITGWVVEIPEDDSVTVAPEKIIRAAYEFNTTPKGRRLPVSTIGEACEIVTAKLFKELLSLIHSEVSETLEGERKVLMDDKLPNRRMPEVELADTFIRIFDYLGGFDISGGFSLWLKDCECDNLTGIAEWIVSTNPAYLPNVINGHNRGEDLFEIHRYISLQGLGTAVMLILKYSVIYGYDIEGAIREKREFNRSRADHKKHNRLAVGGKKF